MNKLLKVVILSSLVVLLGVSFASAATPLKYGDFEVNGIRLGMTSRELIEVMGESISSEEFHVGKNTSPSYWTIYNEMFRYDNIDVNVYYNFEPYARTTQGYPKEGSEVSSIYFKGSCETARGIKIGDTMSDVKKAYGTRYFDLSAWFENGDTGMFYDDGKEWGTVINFIFGKNKKVKEISITEKSYWNN